MTPFVPRRLDSLWLITIGPAIWAVHFMVVYAAAAVWCAKAGGGESDLTTIRVTIAVATAVALAAIAVVGALARRQRGRAGVAGAPYDDDHPHSRRRFVGHAALLLAGLSFVAVIFVALPAAFVETCR